MYVDCVKQANCINILNGMNIYTYTYKLGKCEGLKIFDQFR